MKKFLSLVLALVMTMSLVTVSAGAKDFTDSSKIQYTEAVDVMSAVKVIDGYAEGDFRPSTTLTRGAAAKIICNLILGPTTASALVADAAPYSDVPVNHTFAGYIAYCQKTGIISGYADGTFKPANTLTGYAFMKMLLGALGYDAANEGYVGPNWSIAVAKQAINAGLNKGLTGTFNGVKAVTREEACLFAFNTLKATMVEYTTQTIVVNNGSVSTDKTAKAMEWVGTEKAYDGEKDGKVQFCEKYFEKLTAKYDTDDFGRPVTTWSNDKKDVGTYVRNDLLVKEYTDEVYGADLFNLLGKSVVDDYDFNIAIDGITDSKLDARVFNKTNINKNNKKDPVGGTDLGVLTQVFQDTDEKEVYIAVINTYLAQAKKDYDTKKESADFTVYHVDEKAVTGGYEYIKTAAKTVSLTADNDDVNVENVKEDGFYLVTIASGDIQTVEEAKIVANTEISSFKKDTNVVAAGTKYEYASTAMYDPEVLDDYTGISANGVNLKDITYNIILDTYGNLIGVEKVDEDDNYVFIAGVDTNSSNLSNKNYDATAIFTDGTCKTISYKSDKGTPPTLKNDARDAVLNTWCTYTVDKDGVYTLTVVAQDLTSSKIAQHHEKDFNTEIDKKHIALPTDGSNGAAYGNNDSIYILAKTKAIKAIGSANAAVISGVKSVTTGVKNTSLLAWNESTADAKTKTDTITSFAQHSSGVYTLYKNNGYVIAAVVVGKNNGTTDNLVYVNSGSVASESYNKTTDEWTWTREVILNGEKVTLTEVGDALSELKNMKKNRWYQVETDANNYVIEVSNETADHTMPNWELDESDEYVTNITGLKAAINSADTVLYTQGFGYDAAGKADYSANEPTMKGQTLYVQKNMTEGFFVDEDAKVVFIQTNSGKTTTELATGSDEVQHFIDDLNKKDNAKYSFVISAILENGAAKVVVIRDDTDNTFVAGEETKPSSVTGLPATTITGLTIKVALANGEDATAYEKAVAKLESEGYKVEGVKVIAGGEYEISASKGSVTGYTFTTDTTVYYKVAVKVCDANKAYASVTDVSTEYVKQNGTIDVEVTFATLKSASRTFALDASSTTGVTATMPGAATTIDAKGVATFTITVTSAKDGTIALSWS